MTFSEADRLANRAPTIALLDGRKLELHYGYGGIRRIENEFGSITAFQEILNGGQSTKFFDAVLRGLACGLWRQNISAETLEEQLDSADIEAHAEALGQALVLSFPRQAQTTNDEGESVSQVPSSSPGPTITTLSPVQTVDSVATMTSFG